MTPHRTAAVSLSGRGVVMLSLAAIAGLVAFCWPLLVAPGSALVGNQQAPFIFAAILPMVLAIVVSELSGDGMDVKALAMLGVLSAVGAVLRPLGAGIAGVELVFFLLILAGRVFGPGFGFVLGTTTLFASALLTGGVGPWLPFQMLASGYVGLFAGLLPGVTGRLEIALLAAYAAVSAFGFGFLMNLSFWPFIVGPDTALSFDPNASILANLHAFALYDLATSLAWDLGRAITNVVLVLLAGPGLLVVFRRAARKAAFSPASAAVSFDQRRHVDSAHEVRM